MTAAFRRVPGWGAGRPDWEHGEVPGVALDADDRVFLLVRADPPVRVYDADGAALAAWGSGVFVRPHGISVAPGGAVYCVDDAGHSVHRFSPSGELELTLARTGADEDYDPLAGPGRLEPVARAGPPFNYPTHAIEAPTGEVYVADGYGNARVHAFTRAGEPTASWGESGPGPGEFHLPHGLALDRGGTLHVADRLNSRVQRFDRDGRFLGEWPARRPNSVAFDADGVAYVAELGGVFVFTEEPDLAAERARVSIRSPDGDGLGEVTAAEDGDGATYFAPHAVAVDRQGSVYVGEVPASYSRGRAPAHASVLRKYVPLR
jgi:DNA-binding beta-propeller fold protein YncE